MVQTSGVLQLCQAKQGDITISAVRIIGEQCHVKHDCRIGIRGQKAPEKQHTFTILRLCIHPVQRFTCLIDATAPDEVGDVR